MASQFTFMSTRDAEYLSERFRDELLMRERLAARHEQVITQSAERHQAELTAGRINAEEYAARMTRLHAYRDDPHPVTGARGFRDDLEKDERMVATLGPRLSTAVGDVARNMGVNNVPRVVFITDREDNAQTFAHADRIEITLSLASKLNDREMRFVMAHEMAHREARTSERQSHKAEFEADAIALRATGDIDAAISALKKNPQTNSDTHPGTEARIANLRAVYQEMQQNATKDQVTIIGKELLASAVTPTPPSTSNLAISSVVKTVSHIIT